MGFALGMLIAASFGCSLGYVLGAIMRTGKEADIIQSAQFECEPELWRAIAEKTNAMSALVNRQLEIDEISGAADPANRARLLRTYLKTINQFQREYRDCTAELRRRDNTKASGIA
jgi:hypothetical protein